jgi:ABC-2 type transport system ATP-binding protein
LKSIAVQAESLTKAYGDQLAVDHISFDVGEGEVFGFLGPNGAGKTTTIKMLTTLASVSEGKCVVGGYDVTKEPDAVRITIGLVPQDAAVDNDLKGIENLLLSAKLYQVPNDVAKKRAYDLLDLVGLREASKRLVRTYSGGMRKRLELISGLIHEPRILFLDEPTLGLDVQTRSAIWNYIGGLKKEKNMTIFLTTHYLEEADALCDRVAIIDHGKIRALGSPSELKENVGGDVLEIEATNGVDLLSFFQSVQNVKDVKRVDGKYRIKLPKAEQAFQEIFGELSKMGVKITNIRFEKSSLDQVFLDITGRSLRDVEESDNSGNLWKGLARPSGSTKGHRTIMISETWALAVRDLKKWVRTPAFLFISLLQPIIWLALFGSAFNPTGLVPSSFGNSEAAKNLILTQTFGGAPNYMTYLAGGVLSLLLLFNSAWSGGSIVWDRTLGFLNKLLVAPIPRSSVFLSLVWSTVIKGLLVSLLLLVVGLILPNGLVLNHNFTALDFAGIMATLFLLALGFSSLFTAIAVRTTKWETLVATINMVSLPLFLASGALLPIASMPSWLQNVASLNPMSKASDLIRYFVINGSLSASQLSVALYDGAFLVVFAVACTALGIIISRRGLRMQ